MRRHEKQALVEQTAEARAKFDKMWGHPGLGFALVHAFFDDNPWLTAKDLEDRTELSEDTVRRKLEELVNVGRAKVKRRGRTSYYKAHRDYAEESLNIIKRFILTANCG